MSLASFLGLDTRDVGECIIKIGGADFVEFYANLQSTVVTLKRRDSSEATLTFAMLRDTEGRWPLVEDGRLRTWAQIEIIVVFGESEEPFFSGYIREIDTQLAETGYTSTVVLKCQDIFSAMDRETQQRIWEGERSDLDILEEVIRPYGLTLVSNILASNVSNFHQNKTDYRFIRELAGANYEWYLRDKQGGLRELHFGSPNTDSEASGKLMVHAGRETNCLSFNVVYDGYQPDSVRVSTVPLTGTDIAQANQEPKIQPFGSRSADSKDAGLSDFTWVLAPAHGNDEERAQAQAQAESEERAFKLKATGKLDGTAYGQLLLPGTMVNVGGTGDHNGKWYVDKTTHTFNASGYVVDFELIRNAAAGEESGNQHILAGVL